MLCVDGIEKINLAMRKPRLIIVEGENLLINVKRFFIIIGNEQEKRGNHAHKTLSQLLVCVHGICEVTVDDGENQKIFVLQKPDEALLIPPGIWSKQTYLKPETTLLVACDALYDESDYLRDYDIFLNYRRENT
ncbi:MAG: hypothetical protein ACD_42C00350G0004 [uncultured bacterium]|nr:MAG: hypothetical protein ACD_42C00350G0004 [uncultured bacterium]OGT25509.1 MAG: hypothetical protein A3B71_05575 [Gammaproteobacteria bacterium RIFCSPHIGHO2_02_FULL_42_43]OGT28423.1 MAG: hypothetical protein A2624_01075 [Gammaproteobacteria bacterium RIFCSPHIGHO2_01_FULL_42_8]OGT51462.1 MAG: hypothetical protein A3E54_05340 [Gammaproteobacteria bacterium RIFCSPHIGHO2_12_FULL_41_25]OGT62163.1 MAG: hypothetical protein A3I77_04275 [Gammaproteobacteria bacterium RIFCSPLOWO2_02_FULL_42_14]OGT